MRLLLIGPLPPPLGGATVLFQQLAKELATSPGVSVLIIDTSRKGKTGAFANALCALHVFALLVIRAPQVQIISFHASTRGAILFGPFVWLISKLFRKPFIFHGFGGFFGEWHKSVNSAVRFIFNRTILEADTGLFETRGSIDYFRSVSKSKFTWFPNSRPATVLEPRNQTNQHEARRFIFVGQVTPVKGIQHIIEAGDRISEDIVIDIYGPLMKGITRESFVGKRARYCGILQPDQTVRTIREYDVLLLPTCWKKEGYPGVILEAYSAGVPVIASRIGAIAEIVDSSSGILIEPGSVDQLVGAMQALMSSSQRMEQLREGVAKVRQKFPAGVWTANFLQICQILSERKTSQSSSGL